MALVTPLKQDVEKALRDLDGLQRLFNVYFQGGEEDPPLPQRRALESLMAKIQSQMALSTNASDKFQANALFTRYKSMSARWDKTLRAIETGQIPRPKKRD
jgi:hypothetical protein